MRVKRDGMDAARRPKTCLDDSRVTWKVRVHANVLVIKQRKIRSAVGGLPKAIGRQTGSKRNDAAAQDGANAARSANRANVNGIHIVRVDDDRTDSPPVESRTAIGRCCPHAPMPNGASAVHA